MSLRPTRERVLILHNLEETPLKAAVRVAGRAARAVEILQMAAFCRGFVGEFHA